MQDQIEELANDGIVAIDDGELDEARERFNDILGVIYDE